MLTLSEPDPRGSDGDERLEAPVELIVARCDSAKVFDTTEKALNKVASLVDVAVEGAWLGAVCTRGDNRLCTAGGNGVDQGIAVVGLVGSNRFGDYAFKQRFGCGYVRSLSGCQSPAGKVAERFDQSMDLRTQPSAGPADRLRSFALLGTCRVLMRANDCAVDENLFEITRLVPINNYLIFRIFSCSTGRPQGRKIGLLMELIDF